MRKTSNVTDCFCPNCTELWTN